MTSIGMTIGGPWDVLPHAAKAVEDAGFDAIWLAETGQTAIIQASVCVQATTSVQVGTNIALAFPTAPAAHAMLAWDLAELSGGRFTLGLGSQVKRIITDRFGVPFDPAAARMREYVQAVRVSHLVDQWVVGGPWYRMSTEDLGANLMATMAALAPAASS